MSCTKEEIERKRLAALQKRQSKGSNQNSPQTSSKFNGNLSNSKFEPFKPGPVKSYASNSNNVSRGFHPYAKSSPGAETSSASSQVPIGKVVSGTVYLISEDRFEVNPSEFCTPLINIFKSIPSKNFEFEEALEVFLETGEYQIIRDLDLEEFVSIVRLLFTKAMNPKSKLWNFSINDYECLMSKVAPLAPHIVLGPLPQYVLKILRENITDPSNIDLSPIEATLKHKLMPFQEEGVRFAIARRGRCMIADDMGLGKTFQALAVASYYRQDWPLLIVTTSSMRETWQSKIQELLPSVPLMNIVTLTTSRDALLVADQQTEVVIVSYKITAMHSELLKNKKFGVIIIDESHYLKSHKARCTVSLAHVARRAARVLLLSGTPALSRPAELYTQLQLLQPGLFANYTEYGKRYCDGKQTAFGWDMSGQSNLQELQILLQRKFLIRRTKEQVLTMLESKTRETVLLDESLLQYTKEDQTGLSQMADSYKSKRAADKHAALITFFSETARVKIPAICKYIVSTLRCEPGKFLVFAHHKSVIDAVCSTLDEANTHYICITGTTPTNIRADLVDKFQHVRSCRVAVLSVTAAGAGLTLTAASLVLFAELHWNPGVLTQAESRAHRLGQTGAVRVRYLLAAHTADMLIWPMLQGKLNVLNDVGLSRDTFEDSVVRRQESSTNITQYLTPTLKNKNDYIPGTNIRKDNCKKEIDNNNKTASANDIGNRNKTVSASETDNLCKILGMSEMDNTKKSAGVSETDNINNTVGVSETDICEISDLENVFDEEMEQSFLDDNEGDDLLANLDL